MYICMCISCNSMYFSLSLKPELDWSLQAPAVFLSLLPNLPSSSTEVTSLQSYAHLWTEVLVIRTWVFFMTV